ncbi:hypothetical protein HK104_011451 [Borealophlyctis nickersoniae]|nr:hypothetical protein HK104_011451 [Borealophlyctis nickersoniae]
MAVRPRCALVRSLLTRKFWHLLIAISIFTFGFHIYSNYELDDTQESEVIATSIKGLEAAVKQDWRLRLPKISRVVIAESGGAHQEVMAALILTFGGILLQSPPTSAADPLTKISLYVKTRGHSGFGQVLNGIYPNVTFPSYRLREYKPLRGDTTDELEILVMTTCEQDVYNLRLKPDRLPTRFVAVCVIHHPDYLHARRNLRAMFQGWVRHPEKIRFLMLSPHTEHYLTKRTFPNHWGKLIYANGKKVFSKEALHKLRTGWFAPVFPAPLHIDEPKKDGNKTIISIQGSFESKRRNYTHIFASLYSILHPVDINNGATPPPNVHIRLIGSGKPPKIPSTLKNHVTILRDLSYPQYYKALGTSSLLLPAFGSEYYYINKASSSIPASIIAGVPVLASHKLLKAYGYLSPDAAIIQEEGEDDMEAVARVIEEGGLLPDGRWGKAGLRDLKRNVQRMRERLIEENLERVAKLLL